MGINLLRRPEQSTGAVRRRSVRATSWAGHGVRSESLLLAIEALELSGPAKYQGWS